jgi:hypothetical protein
MLGLSLLGLSAINVAFVAHRLRRLGLGKSAIALIGMLIIHPGWWMSATRGDCGRSLVFWSTLISIFDPGRLLAPLQRGSFEPMEMGLQRFTAGDSGRSVDGFSLLGKPSRG